MNVEELITAMQEVKAEHSNLEIQEILKIFQIKAINEQTKQLRIANQK